MTREEELKIEDIYSKFVLADESSNWDELDDCLEKLDWLSDSEMLIEAKFQAVIHMVGKIGCLNENCKNCHMPLIVEAVASILEAQKEKNTLLKRDRYVLAYYLAMSHLKLIVSTDIK